MNDTEQNKLGAAVWFAVAGIVPAMGAYVAFTQYVVLSTVLFILLPIVLMAVAGYAIGYAVLDASRVRTGWHALLRGLLAGLAAYLGFWLLLVIVRVALSGPSSLSNALLLFPVYYPIVFLLFILSGGIAGWLRRALVTMEGWLVFVAAAVLVPAAVVILSSLPNPYHLPIYPDAKNVQQGQFEPLDSTSAESMMITFDAQDPAEEVLAYYQTKLPREGWQASRLRSSLYGFGDPGGNYAVRVSQGSQPGEFQIALWHSTLWQFP